MMLLLSASLTSVLQAQSPPCSDNQPSTIANITPVDPPDTNPEKDQDQKNPPLCTGGIRVEEPPVGTNYYNLDNAGNKIKVTVRMTDCGQVFDWEVPENIVIDKVVAKGGTQNANVYYYPSGSSINSDAGLHVKRNLNEQNNSYTETFAMISHVDFCFHYRLTVSKTAATSFTRTYKWTIDKTVSPATWNFFCGDKGTSNYKIEVKGNGYTDANWAVTGTITVANNTPKDAIITSVADVLSGGITGNVVCTDKTFPYILASGQSFTCSYSASLASATNGTNTATVSTSSPLVEGSSGTANYTFGNPTTEVNKTVTISDDKYTPASPWTATYGKDETFTYTKEFSCTNPANSANVCDNGGTYTFNNTATITETGQSDGASVTVNCYKLQVTKNAATALTRTWAWTIEKSADQTDLTLSAGQSFLVNYSVAVNATPSDANWAASGNISVYNPAPVSVVINGISDVVSTGIAANVTCGVTFPYTLAAGATLNCTYTVSLPDATTRTNTATATMQNYSTDATGNKTAIGTTAYTGTASVDFTNAAITKVDDCASVTDTYVGALGTVCAGVDALPKTFTYSYNVGLYTTSGIYQAVNTAMLVTSTGEKKSDDNWTVVVTVPSTGCTLTQGYWKTHSMSGPAPYDDAWKNLGGLEENTLFFKSGITWINVFRTPPAGNAFYNLAHQYMAAKLNVLNGAGTTTAVATAIASAEALFNSLASGSVTLTSAQTRTARTLASTLDQYNNGLIGPGHCDESNGTTVTSSSAAAPVADVVEESQTAPVIVGTGIKAWPNPSTAGFTLRFESQNLQAPVQLRVFDMNGRVVHSASGTANRNFTFGDRFAKGIYMVEITQDKERKTMRLIKQ